MLSRAMARIGSTRVIAMAPVSWKVDGLGRLVVDSGDSNLEDHPI